MEILEVVSCGDCTDLNIKHKWRLVQFQLVSSFSYCMMHQNWLLLRSKNIVISTSVSDQQSLCVSIYLSLVPRLPCTQEPGNEATFTCATFDFISGSSVCKTSISKRSAYRESDMSHSKTGFPGPIPRSHDSPVTVPYQLYVHIGTGYKNVMCMIL